MPNEFSPSRLGVEPEIIKRAKIILGSLLFLFVTFTVLGIYQGVTSGEFNLLLKEFTQSNQTENNGGRVSTELELVEPTPSASSTPTPIPTKTTTPAKSQQVTNCIRKNIREGEFTSNKCYAPQDYDDLEYYLGRYDDAIFSLQIANDSMRITCNCRVQQECDFFKDSCERDKQKKSQAESDTNKYKGIIQGIIAKGK